MSGKPAGKYQQVISEIEFESLPINTGSHQQLLTNFGSVYTNHRAESYDGLNFVMKGTSNDLYSIEDEIEEENISKKATAFQLTSMIALSLGFIIVIITVSTHYATLGGSRFSTNKKMPPLSLFVDYGTNEYKIIDNYPLLNPSVTFNTKIGNSNLREHVLAYGTFQFNVNGNGWNYLNVETVNLADYNIMDSVPSTYRPPRNLLSSHGSDSKSNSNSDLQHKDGHKVEIVTEKDFDDLVSQQYFRTMEAIGYLEGYATCEIMSEWYVNFYSGLFDGGNPTDESIEFLLENHDWMVEQSNALWQTSDYWRTVRGILSQLTGMVNGANAGCPGSETTMETAEKGVYLSNLSKQHSIIHMLLVNANGDLYQIADKYEQWKAGPSDVLEDIPNDDGFFFEINKKNTSTGGWSSTGGEGGGKGTTHTGDNKRSESDRDKHLREKHERDDDKHHNYDSKEYYYNRKDAQKRIENRKKYHKEHHRERKLQQDKYDEEERVLDETNLSRRSRRLYTGVTDGLRKGFPEHCSAIIKLLEDKSDVVFGHDTWDDFQNAAPRIFKHYTFNIMQGSKPLAMHSVQFSSSPGMITSNDDYFILQGNANIAVMETTIDMLNRTLLNDIAPQTMLSWSRSHVANQMATDGQSWCQIFSTYASGTYVNQWMVMDLTKFTPFQDPLPGFLHILEEIPGYIHYEDMTTLFTTQTYWPSYNNPYFSDIAELSLNSQLCAENANYCYQTDPRANIFRANQDKVVGVKDLEWLLSYNDFQNDPFSQNNSCKAIACRNDLQPNVTTQYPFGQIDTKISSAMLATRPMPITITRLGPTTDQQPPFCWAPWDLRRNKRGERFHHAGHPACFDYDWQTMPPFLNEL